MRRQSHREAAPTTIPTCTRNCRDAAATASVITEACQGAHSTLETKKARHMGEVGWGPHHAQLSAANSFLTTAEWFACSGSTMKLPQLLLAQSRAFNCVMLHCCRRHPRSYRAFSSSLQSRRLRAGTLVPLQLLASTRTRHQRCLLFLVVSPVRRVYRETMQVLEVQAAPRRT